MNDDFNTPSLLDLFDMAREVQSRLKGEDMTAADAIGVSHLRRFPACWDCWSGAGCFPAKRRAGG